MSIEQSSTRASYDEVVNALRALRKDIDDLVNQSQGVAGLHMNGDVAEWDSLLPGGTFGAWLASVEDADAVLARVDQPDPVHELIEMLSAAENEEGVTVFDHTPEEIGLHVMENHAAVLAALREKANG